VPLLPPGASTKLVLADQKILPVSGIVALSYSVPGGVGPAPRIRYIKAARTVGKKGMSTRRTVSQLKATRKRSTKKKREWRRG